MKPGVRTTEHWRVGKMHRIRYTERAGLCISVTPWGNDRVRWVRLLLADGSERSFAPADVENLTTTYLVS